MGKVVRPEGKTNILLKYIVRLWEKRIGLYQLRYSFPKKKVNGVSHYYRWIRYTKEQIDLNLDRVPPAIRPQGHWYPCFNATFQNRLMNLLLDTYSEDLLKDHMSKDWYDWIYENRDRRDSLIKGVEKIPTLVEFMVRAWERQAGTALPAYNFPKYIKHFHPQRFVTLFLYLNDVPRGGETVFPYSTERYVTNIERPGMSECSEGLAVPARKLHASLFYVQTGENEVDVFSNHGGCPPEEGIKWGSNSFMWNVPSQEGSLAWR